MRPTAPRSDTGFTLIELLVVMIVVGVLAAVAIPVFLNQRQRAHDTATRSDVANVGKEVATFFVDGTGATSLDLTVEPGRAVISDGVRSTSVNLTNGTARPSTGAYANLDDPQAWCVSLTDPDGRIGAFRFSASAGLEPGTC